MFIICLVITSILIPLLTAFLAFRVLIITGKQISWAFIAIAMLLQASRSVFTLVGLINAEILPTQVIIYEWVGTAVSVLMLIGVTGFGLFLKRSKRNSKELQLTEEKLFESEFRFNKLWENGPFGLVMVDQAFQYTNVNPVFCKILGYSEAELLQLKFKDISHPDDLIKDLPNVRKLINKEISVYKTEKRYIRKDGQVIWGALTVNSNYDKEGRFLYNLAIVEDITRRKLAEENLKKSKTLLTETESIGKVGGWEFNIDTLEMTWTEEVYRIHEVDFDFYHNVSKGINFYTMESRPIIEKAVQRVIEFGEPFDLELEIISAKGNIKKVHTIGKPDMENHRVYGFFQDITERKLAEEEIRKLNDELEQRVIERTSQLEAANKELEAFSYSVSHDLRAPLRGINGFAQILLDDFAPKLDDEAKRICFVILQNSRKMGQLIDELLAFSRLSRVEMQFSEIEMSKLIQSIYQEFTDITTREKIELKMSNICNVTGDATMMKQVWVNLLLNAVKYSSKKEKATITISSKNENGNCIYCINDNGVGFDMAYANKLFGVFQRLHTTKEFEGTGVGLAIVQRIIHRHGGKVWAEGEVNKGASFYFSLPIITN